MSTPTIPEPPEGTFVCWFDTFNDPAAVYYRTDQHGEAGEEDRWYNATQGMPDEVMTWTELLKEAAGFRGPVELISNGELAGRQVDE